MLGSILAKNVPHLSTFRRNQSYLPRILLLVLLLFVLLSHCEAKETVLMSSLSTKNDRILFGILKETNYLLPSWKIIQGRKFQCLSIIKNQLVKNVRSTYFPLNYSFTYLDLILIQSTFLLGEIHEEPEKFLKYRIEKVLSGLAGICVYFRTNTFLTEYCHKEHVRQYDDDYTRGIHRKTEYQDFNLGKFKEQLVFDIRPKQTQKQQKPDLPPKHSDFTAKYQHLIVEAAPPTFDFVEIEEDIDGKVVHSNAPIVYNSNYLQSKAVFVSITCNSTSTGKVIRNTAWVVNPFQAVYTSKMGSCSEGGQLRLLDVDIAYEHLEDIRVFGSYLFGKVEETCTKKWNWEKEGRPFEFARLKPGSILYIEYFKAPINKVYKRYVTVKKVHHSELIELEEQLGFSLKSQLHFTYPNSSSNAIIYINRCDLFFQQPLNFSASTLSNRFINRNMMVLNQNQTSSPGQRLGCFCDIQTGQSSMNYIDMDVTVGNRLWLNYYQVYLKTNQKIYVAQKYRDLLFRECSQITCFKYKSIEPLKQEKGQSKKFTSLTDLNQDSKIYNVSSEEADNVYVVSILKGGIIKMITQSSEGVMHTYLLSEGQILRIREFQNGTKQIEKQNQFYENATRYQDQTIYNMLYIYCFNLPNGSYFGGIWKHRQYVQFPRIKFLGQKILFFELSSGYGYIRKLDLSRMKHPSILAITNYLKIMEEQYQWKEIQNYYLDRNIQQQFNSVFLNDSYSINFTYSGGDFCGDPINKKRETIVTLKCGTPWYQITEVRQTSPCSYWLEIETLLLCEENLRDVVENDAEIPNKSQLDKMIFSGVVCMREEAFDEVHSLLYPGKDMLRSE